MSEQEPQSKKTAPSNTQIVLFVITLSFTCALVLAVLASALKEPQEIAKELDRSEQMLIAARIFTHEGYFLIKDDKGNYVPAKYVGQGRLEPSDEKIYATRKAILEVYKSRLIPFLVDSQGDLKTFEQAHIDMDEYLAAYKKSGYYKQPLKLIYEILPNPKNGQVDKTPIGYVIPVNGFGLWDAIYGYLALEPDGETVIGISWYEQKETPGLGANIAEADWQNQFHGKLIFQPSPDGQVDPKTDPIGITVVKGKVNEVIGNKPKAKSAVDGMPGATLTGNGVTEAYHDVLSAYRPFFVKLNQEEVNDV